ncbi:MAG: 4-hydroxy-3-methylbut-2-en-1-yl diphosphate synthase [Bacteroidetes bacterium GWF2_40_14]|nr:MAG: 4-hydroxy-3-methylbut-2-en-1-yl diphosphate synthase [Bacteroidetes bacterium GWF2_40_14]
MRKTVVKAGSVLIGDNSHIVIQTMCNTPTQDIDASFEQCVKLSIAGAEIIRLTTQGYKEVEALKVIKEMLRKKGIHTPLVADVHFSPDVAKAAAMVADKVRINPGNFSKDHTLATKRFVELTDICKQHGTALRIGINHGSLGDRIIEKHGDTPAGMKESAIEWIKMALSNNFDQIVISLKSSNTLVMAQAYRLLQDEFKKTGLAFPLHLGVTEAGNGEYGRIKSAVGIASLLNYGIGDTIRVSLTEDPENELPVARFIADYSFEFRKNKAEIPFDIIGSNPVVCRLSYKCKTWSDFILSASCDFGPLLLDKKIDDIEIQLVCDEKYEKSDISRFRDELLQASRRVFSKPEYIACPGCGRTTFNLETVFNEVKRRTAHLTGYNIAVMGCIVNGPGEMADADYGYVGESRNKVSIYKGRVPVFRAVPENEAIDILLKIIEEDIQNKSDKI